MTARQEIREAYEKSGWSFDNTGGDVVMGWKNVTLKNGKRGCIAVSSDSIVIHQIPTDPDDDFFELVWDERNFLQTYDIRNENNSKLVSLFLYDILEEISANEVCECMDRFWRYDLVR